MRERKRNREKENKKKKKKRKRKNKMTCLLQIFSKVASCHCLTSWPKKNKKKTQRQSNWMQAGPTIRYKQLPVIDVAMTRRRKKQQQCQSTTTTTKKTITLIKYVVGVAKRTTKILVFTFRFGFCFFFLSLCCRHFNWSSSFRATTYAYTATFTNFFFVFARALFLFLLAVDCFFMHLLCFGVLVEIYIERERERAREFVRLRMTSSLCHSTTMHRQTERETVCFLFLFLKLSFCSLKCSTAYTVLRHSNEHNNSNYILCFFFASAISASDKWMKRAKRKQKKSTVSEWKLKLSNACVHKRLFIVFIRVKKKNFCCCSSFFLICIIDWWERETFFFLFLYFLILRARSVNPLQSVQKGNLMQKKAKCKTPHTVDGCCCAHMQMWVNLEFNSLVCLEWPKKKSAILIEVGLKKKERPLREYSSAVASRALRERVNKKKNKENRKKHYHYGLCWPVWLWCNSDVAIAFIVVVVVVVVVVFFFWQLVCVCVCVCV